MCFQVQTKVFDCSSLKKKGQCPKISPIIFFPYKAAVLLTNVLRFFPIIAIHRGINITRQP